MIRLVDTAFIIAAIAGALWTYNIKHEADEQADTLSELRAQIRIETDRIAVLVGGVAADAAGACLSSMEGWP